MLIDTSLKVLLPLMLIAVFVSCKTNTVIPPVHLVIQMDNSEDVIINPWVSEEGICYYFLPSFAKSENVFFSLDEPEIKINDVILEDSLSLSRLYETTVWDKDGCFVLNFGGQNQLKVRFLLSQNVPSLIINTETGSLDSIHADKQHVENININIVDSTGVVVYSSDNCTLKGRENGTWGAEKKPYVLKLPQKEGLLGMHKRKKWVLLANAYDETNLRNWLAFTIAKRVGMVGTPDCRFVDVYANGNYLGLYFLTEKVSEKLVAKGNYEPVLVKIDGSAKGDNMFKTTKGIKIEVENVGINDYDIDAVKKQINKFEEMLFDGDWVNHADLESWAKKYLVEEIMENGDAGARSNYYYYYPDSSIFYGGPVWDYDLSLGRNKYICGNPYTFTALREWRTPSEWTPYFSLMLSNELFQSKVKYIYTNIFKPILDSIINHDLYDIGEELNSSIIMNSIRWAGMYNVVRKAHHPVVCNVEELSRFLCARVSFLEKAWIGDKKYHLIQMSYNYGMEGQYMCFSVEDSTAFSSSCNVSDPEFDKYYWKDRFTGEAFNPTQIANSDRQFILDDSKRTKDR